MATDQSKVDSSNHSNLNLEQAYGQYVQTLKREADAILDISSRNNADVVDAIRLLLDCKGRYIVTGMGKMSCIARKAASTFSSTGSPAIFLHPSEAVHGDLGIVTDADVLVAISNSGETGEVLELIPFMKRNEIPIIAVAGNTGSTLAGLADVVIDASVKEEADPDSIAPTCSTTVALAICDALAVALMQQRGFTKEQFAIFHPGGQLGRKLLLKTNELMHVGEKLPTVNEKATLSEAIKVISAKRMGAAFVVGDDGRLLGVLTDGDVRRIFEATALDPSKNPLAGNVADFATMKPACISASSLAAEALSLMEEREITVLPVLDDQHGLVGVVHLHDLIRSGLA